MTMFKKILALSLCLLLAAATPLLVAAEDSVNKTATFTFETVEEADFVMVNMNLAEANTMIGALEMQLSYDETYLEIVTNPDPTDPDDPYFDCPFTYDQDGIIYAGNEKNMKYALASAKGVQKNGLFLTLCFRVIRDIPAGELAEVSGEVTLIRDNSTSVSNDGYYRYQTQIITGGVMGTDFKPTNKLFTNQRTGIEAITVKEDSISDAQFKTRLHGESGNAVLYDIGFQDDQQEVQPDGTVVVRIPLPEHFDKEKCTVYHVEEDGTSTEMHIVVRDNYLVLETQGFSRYIVKDPTLPEGELELAPAFAYGDLNNNGQVDAADALMILKSVVGKLQLDADQQAAAEVSDDKTVDAQDALFVLKMVVTKIQWFPVEER